MLSLKEILTKSVIKATEKESLLRHEVEKLVDYILDNSTVESNKSIITLKSGNMLGGVDRASRDKKIEVPRFLMFRLDKLQEKDIIKGKMRDWELKTFSSFNELEIRVGYYSSSEGSGIVALIDGRVMEYKVMYELADDYSRQWGSELKWQSIKPYKVKYIEDGEEIIEEHRSKLELKVAILELVKERIAEDIRAFVSIGYDKELYFSVTEEVYNSKTSSGEYNMILEWFIGLEDTEDEEGNGYWGWL